MFASCFVLLFFWRICFSFLFFNFQRLLVLVFIIADLNSCMDYLPLGSCTRFLCSRSLSIRATLSQRYSFWQFGGDYATFARFVYALHWVFVIRPNSARIQSFVRFCSIQLNWRFFFSNNSLQHNNSHSDFRVNGRRTLPLVILTKMFSWVASI